MNPKLKRLIQLSHKVRSAVVETKMFSPKSLAGGCGTASYHLMRCARKNGMSVRFVHGRFTGTGGWSRFHAWIEYQGHVIDLTKRQFDDYPKHSPEVAVIPFAEATEYGRENPGIRTPIIRDAWKGIDSWALYPATLKNNLIILERIKND